METKIDVALFTEGKTDWKLIKKAKEVLGIEENISFHEEEKSIGDAGLLQMCEKFSMGIPAPFPYIFIFDWDNKEIIRKVTVSGQRYKDWGKNIYSLVLPLPNFRKGYESISIEYLFRDEDLKIMNSDGRRIYSSVEFDECSGNHHNDPTIHVGNINKLKGFCVPNNPKIVDSDNGVFNSTGNNIALSKSDYTDLVVSEVAPFDKVRFDGFAQLFSVIKEVIKTSKPIPIKINAGEQLSANNINVQYSKTSFIDHPPTIPIFVGRESYIHQFDNSSLRVIAITGLGGEGKSTLATQYFNLAKQYRTKVHYEKCGWCDCKEIETTFHERLLVLIEELTNGDENKQRFSEENVNDTIRRFVTHLNAKESLIIFDNVDAFVDKDSLNFVSTVKQLFDALTSTLVQSTVIFTCRPAIHDFHQTFLEIPLAGLSFMECLELATRLNIAIREDRLRMIHGETRGHALWMNLIFGQLRSGRLSENNIQETIVGQTKLYNDLNVLLLRSIWKTLNPKEKEVIYALSVFTRPPDIKKIERTTGIAYLKCIKIINTLILLRLVLEIDQGSGKILYDLHPIIRSKAIDECNESKIQNILTKIVAILIPAGWDSLSIIMKGRDYARNNLENYIEWAETALEHHDYKDAIKSIEELSKYMWMIGEDAKFIDLCKRLFGSLDNEKYKVGTNASLLKIFKRFINTLLQQGEERLAKKYLDEFVSQMRSTKEFIYYATLQSFYLWFTNDYEKGIDFSRKAMKEIAEKNEEIPFELSNSLALALRENGIIDEAIIIFSSGKEKKELELWDVNCSEDLSSAVGNIGRCYFLQGEYKKALDYISRSAESLRIDESRLGTVNYGYALLWLSDIYIKMNNYEAANQYLLKAVDTWREYAPARLKQIEKHIEKYPRDFMEKYTIIVDLNKLVTTQL